MFNVLQLLLWRGNSSTNFFSSSKQQPGWLNRTMPKHFVNLLCRVFNKLFGNPSFCFSGPEVQSSYIFKRDQLTSASLFSTIKLSPSPHILHEKGIYHNCHWKVSSQYKSEYNASALVSSIEVNCIKGAILTCAGSGRLTDLCCIQCNVGWGIIQGKGILLS